LGCPYRRVLVRPFLMDTPSCDTLRHQTWLCYEGPCPANIKRASKGGKDIMSAHPKPIFLFSLPRSGSTLLQRILAAHREIHTVPEPWILLPPLYALKRDGVRAEYGHTVLAAAVEDFCRNLPNGKEDYFQEIRNFALNLYSKCARGERYFLDKTPRYHLIAGDILRMFPEGKFIFLWRNPLAIVASMVNTWARGMWNLRHFKLDLFDGLANLVEAYRKNRSGSCAVRYEDLVNNTEDECRNILSELDIDFDPQIVSSLGRVRLSGRMGDSIGQDAYETVSNEPLGKWQSTLTSPTRKLWCRRYLRWIGRERLSLMGYSLNELLSELNAAPSTVRFLASDLLCSAYNAFRSARRGRRPLW